MTTTDAGPTPASDAVDADARAGDGRVRETATLSVVPPAIARTDVESDGRVGAVAYPYRIHEAEVTMTRPYLSDRVDTFVVSVDRSRRIPVRSDVFPDVAEHTLDDVLVLDPDLEAATADAMARDAVFKWTLRQYSLRDPPDISFARTIDAHKLFWIADRADGDVVIDSVTGEERALAD